MLKKSRILGIIVLIASAACLLSSCKTEASKSLTFFNYGENIDQATIDAFFDQTGVRVNVETFDDMETMYQKVSKSSAVYDVLLVSDVLMPRMIQEGLIQKIDLSKLPHLSQMDSQYMNLAFDPNNDYSVPYMFGTVGIVYNQEKIKEPVESWSSLFDPSNRGRVFMFDTYRDTLGAALKSLGYSLNTTDPSEILQAKELLERQKSEVAPLYGVDNGTQLIAAGETDINMIWSGEGLNLQEEYPQLKYVVPKEGSNFWIDSLCVSSSTKNADLALSFINFVSDKDAALRIADEIGYTTPNREARLLQPTHVKENPYAYMDATLMKQCEIYKDLDSTTKDLYYKAWTEIKAK